MLRDPQAFSHGVLATALGGRCSPRHTPIPQRWTLRRGERLAQGHWLVKKKQGQEANSACLVSKPCAVSITIGTSYMSDLPSPILVPSSSKQVVIASGFSVALSPDSLCSRAERREPSRTREGLRHSQFHWELLGSREPHVTRGGCGTQVAWHRNPQVGRGFQVRVGVLWILTQTLPKPL